jgi:hypothetical protein
MRPRHLAVSVGVVFGLVSTSGGAAAVVPAVKHAITDAVTAKKPARKAAPVTGPGETAFFTAVLRDLGAPVTRANLTSLAGWADREGPWGTVGKNNPLDTTQPMPGSTWFNTITTSSGGVIHVQNYPTATEGAEATAATIANGFYPHILGRLTSGTGLCEDLTATAAEFTTWGGYSSPVC